jgi:hypothetical protein
VHGPREPRRERLTEAFETGRREREQAGAVVRTLERDDPRLAGRKQRRAQRDLNRVLPGDAELRGPRQAATQLAGDGSIGEVSERMRDRRCCDRLHDAGIAVSEHGDAEPGRKVKVFAAVLVPDATAFGAGPDQTPAPLRRPTSRPSVSAAMYPASFGFS